MRVLETPNHTVLKLAGRPQHACATCRDTYTPGGSVESPGLMRPMSFVRPAFLGFDRADMNPSVKAGDDFFEHAIGGYLARNPIPDDQARYGVDQELGQKVESNLKALIEELATRPNEPGSNEQKLADFYASGMDTARIEQAGASPLNPFFSRIDAMTSLRDLGGTVAELHSYGIPGLFSFGASVDVKDSTRVIAETFQGGLGLPDKEYYTTTEDADKLRIRTAYQAHVSKMFELLGEPPEVAAQKAQTVLSVETRLAEGSLSRAEMRDPAALYNPMDRAQVSELAPSLDFDAYLAGMGQSALKDLNVATPAFFTKLEGALGAVPLDDWKTYLKWQALNAAAPYLSESFETQSFEFKGKEMKGLKAQPPRFKRVLQATDDNLGEALGQKYVERHFPPEAKTRVQEMVGNIKLVLEDKLEKLPWMTEETRQRALEKLDSFTEKIGYPDKWTDYSGLAIEKGVYCDNVLAASRFAVQQRLASIGQPVDRTRWEMTPPTINAYYQPVANEIVFPAGILAGVYFDQNADDATNYGAIGAVIGHEIGHGFDDEGAQFDARGNLNDWWTPEDKERFRTKVEGVATQFSEFSYDGVQCDGHLVLGEALADLGGLELAYDAYKLASEGKPPRRSPDGFTDDQRFFLSYARSWATNVRPEYAKMVMQTDPHPLPKFRVNGTLANFEPFHRAFNLQPGEAMVRPPETRNTVWN